VAPALFTITTAGKKLAPTTTEVGLGVEGDVEFHLTYPRPSAGPLQLDAVHVATLSSGHGNVVTVDGGAPPAVVNLLLTPTDHVFALMIPPQPVASRARVTEVALPALAIAIALGGTGWLWRRKAPA
jgi:hypothetical protein